MALLSRKDLETLLEEDSGTCVSLYVPTMKKGAETQQNPIRFKNLLREVEHELAEAGWEEDETARFLEPLHELQDTYDFWQHQDNGLAVFRSDDLFEYFKLPFSVEERVTVADRFYLKPMFHLLRGDGRFYILALSQKKVRLLEASRYHVKEVELPDDVPTSLEDVVGHELKEEHIQYHTGTSTSGPAGGANGGAGGGSGRSPIYHGHGGGEKDDRKQEVSKFFHELDRSIHEHLHNKSVPLVLAGVEYLIPIYREASSHQNLLEEGVSGNPDAVSADELHERAWEIVRPMIISDREKAAERFQELVGTGKASAQLDEVVTAAFDGRVDTLFVAETDERWGHFDPAEREVQHYDEPQNGAEDLLDYAAVRTFMNGGTVYALEGDRLPEAAGSVAAIFRY